MNSQHPDIVTNGLLQIVLGSTVFGYIALDEKGKLLAQGGELSSLGLPAWELGDKVLEDVPFLQGCLPVVQGHDSLTSVELPGSQIVDVHLFGEPGATWVILVDKTEALKWEAIARQKTNELHLLEDRLASQSQNGIAGSAKFEFFDALDLMALRRLEDGCFELIKPASQRFADIYPEAFSSPESLCPQNHFPFIENFMVDAEAVWQNPESSEQVQSGPWVEISDTGEEVPLYAFAKTWRGMQLLFVGILNEGYQQGHRFLQQGRESALAKRRLEAEIQARGILEEGLVEARNAAEEANRAKTDFLSSMSHELRNPMNAILGFGQLLVQDASLPNEHQDSVQEILNAGQHLLTLINEVLDLARVESGNIDLSLEPVALGPVIEECLSLMASSAKQYEIQLTLQHIQRMTVRADRTRLKQVLLNLLSNAVKYNRDGGSVTVHAAPAANDRARIQVTDTGQGIAQARMGELFVPFNRLDAENSGIEGTGIGLCITRQLVELMGGSVGASSVQGRGSTFWIELPLAADLDTEAQTAGQKAGTPDIPIDTSARQQTVLCIDDNPSNLALLSRILKRAAHMHILTAHTPEMGIELALTHRPDLILLDINMPGMDGYQVLQALKADARLKHTPVLAITANAMPRDIERGIAAGFTDYLTKPLDVAGLMDAVKRHLVGDRS